VMLYSIPTLKRAAYCTPRTVFFVHISTFFLKPKAAFSCVLSACVFLTSDVRRTVLTAYRNLGRTAQEVSFTDFGFFDSFLPSFGRYGEAPPPYALLHLPSLLELFFPPQRYHVCGLRQMSCVSYVVQVLTLLFGNLVGTPWWVPPVFHSGLLCPLRLFPISHPLKGRAL